ncbi:MAG: glycosyltransferase family 2 protein [Rhodospirillales bacterium]|nr:glycosyltransferase family 2 protein [Rhodospirillales bacterium]MDE2575058.1 glycosyltransferase family 2 protein [Rhodospirillales bacterium]
MLADPAGARRAGRHRIAVVIPCYRVRAQVLGVLAGIGAEVGLIVVVDDACPEQSGQLVRERCADPRVRVITHARNQGVGGAVLTGYAHAAREGAEVIVKLDGDGQMDPSLIPRFVRPILEGKADYTKGNRFYNIDDVRAMPPMRLFGNAVLSFLTKLSSGYWSIFDPTNGFTAISAAVYEYLPLAKISRRYFFESDMLFRLGTMRASVLDIPMVAVYGDETSNLRIGRVMTQFLAGNLRNTFKRVVYSYFLRDFSVASLQLVAGILLLAFGVAFGVRGWMLSDVTGVTASTGTVMLAALPVILGVQLLLSFLGYDISATPSAAIHPLLPARETSPAVPAEALR